MKEKWKPLGAYEVSSLGRVRRKATGRVLKPFRSGRSGYQLVRLYQPSGVVDCLVHKLVAEVFEVRGHGTELNHRDMDKDNNRPSNLEWTTRSGNMKHARRGKQWGPRGEDVVTSKLTEKDVRQIRALPSEFSQREIAESYGISQVAVSQILRRVRWKHVK